MRNLRTICGGALCAAALFSSLALQAADVKTYQVTGPVLAVTPTSITVQKGNDKWEIARSKDTQVTGDIKVGAKVTVVYQMLANDITVKEGKVAKDKAAKPTEVKQ